MTSRPIEEAALAVKQALSRLEGAEERIFHARMRVLRAARELKLWTLDLDPELGVPFVRMERWIRALWPQSFRYAKDALETEEALASVPMETLTQITGANLKVLADEGLSSNLRSNPAVLEAAKDRTKESFVEYLNGQHGQHIEPIRLMPKVDTARFDAALEMVMVVEDCNRGEALVAIAGLVEQEYLVRYEHKREGAA